MFLIRNTFRCVVKKCLQCSICFSPPHQHDMARQGAMSIEDIIKNKIAHFRRWKQTKLSKRRPKWGFQFSVMTYNILSQVAVENHRFLYKHCSNTFLQEDYRVSRILPEILNSRSDIICLQEVEQHVFEYRIKELFQTNGFESIFKKKTSSKGDGCAILWRKKKFDLLQHCEVEFKANGNKFLNRDNVGLIAVLKPIHPNLRDINLHVATTHLLFNPRRGEVKLCQLRLLLAELERLALKEISSDGQHHYHPIILCGDFNIEPHSPLYQFIESGFVDLTNVLSGDMSGQTDGKKRGKCVNGEQLSLHKLGINQSSRYEDTSENKLSTSVPNSQSFANSGSGSSNLANPPTIESVDPSILLAIGKSDDPRWITTLKAMGHDKLAQDLASKQSAVPKTSVDFKTNKAANSNDSEDMDSSDGRCEQSDLQFSHNFKFIPAYKFQTDNPKDMPITSMTGCDYNTVDHIFYTVREKQNINTYTEGKLKLLGVYGLMRKDDIDDIGGLPNAHLGSDHTSLIAQFGLCCKR
ncbi:protein angel homolog 2 isoform X2 [Parasteatoda tepidariorum]|uniref:protein angel homolog 2 isoform X2 n=1 Tax=Parasteatoda tepidariorum TaxID=114398 RepID=UPI00077F8773